MFTGKFVSNCMGNNIDDIKYAALYYDKVEILDNIVYTLTKPNSERISTIRGVDDCIDDVFRDHLKMLESEGIVEYIISEDNRLMSLEDKNNNFCPIDLELRLICARLMETAGNQIFDVISRDGQIMNCISNKEVIDIHSVFKNKLEVGSQIDIEFIHTYYENLIYYIIKFMYEGANVITTSKIVDQYFSQYYLKGLSQIDNIKKPISKDLAVMTIKHFVPNVLSLSFEDILEIRHRAKDELLEYRYYMEEMNKKMVNEYQSAEICEYANNFIKTQIQPSVRNLQRKISSSKIRVVQTFLDEIKDVNSYTPLLASIFTKLPVQVSLLCSAGLISAKTLMKMKEEQYEIKNNGLYYIYDLTRRI